jgi:type III secretion protein U
MSHARIYEPTSRKLAEARKRGQWPHSRDLVSATALLAALLTFWWAGDWMVGRLRASWGVALAAIRAGGDEASLAAALKSCAWLGVEAVAPLIAAVLGAVVLASFLQVGPLFSFQALSAKAKPFDIGQGLQRLASGRRAGDAALGCTKTAVLIVVAAIALRDGLPGVVGMLQGSPDRAFGLTAELGRVLLLRVGAALALIAALDYIYQRYRFLQDQKMTREELERERRETELDSRFKAKRQRFHQELLVDQRTPSDLPPGR